MRQDAFKSILNPNWRYCRSEGFYESNLLVHGFGWYDTMGDGEVQHSPVARIGQESFTDFCLSMAANLLANPAYHVYAHEIGLEPISRAVFERLGGVQWKEGKAQYVSLTLTKVTTSKIAANDRRYEAVPDFADGSVKGAFDLWVYLGGVKSGTMLLRRYSAVKMWFEMAGDSLYSGFDCMPWARDLSGDHNQAWCAMRAAFESKDKAEWAKRMLDNATQNSRPQEEQAAA